VCPSGRLAEVRDGCRGASFLVNQGVSLYLVYCRTFLGILSRVRRSVMLTWLDKPCWTLLRWSPALSAVPRLMARPTALGEPPVNRWVHSAKAVLEKSLRGFPT